MAKTSVCDGCGKVQSADDKFEVIGIVSPCDYCADCAVVAKEYLAGRDEVHDKAQKTWLDGVKKLRTSFKGKLNVLPS